MSSDHSIQRKRVKSKLYFLVFQLVILFNEPPQPEAWFEEVGSENYVRSSCLQQERGMNPGLFNLELGTLPTKLSCYPRCTKHH